MPNTEDLAIMNCALALPSKYTTFKQAVCVAYACESKHQVTCFHHCVEMAKMIKKEEDFIRVPMHERNLFNIIHVAIDKKYNQVKAPPPPVSDWQSDRWNY
jgi:hypothetical protein